jgi:hypothetical protein
MELISRTSDIIQKNCSYHLVYDVIRLNNKERKQKYYMKNWTNILRQFICYTALPRTKWHKLGSITVKIGWSDDYHIINYNRDLPEVEFKFLLTNFNNIILMIYTYNEFGKNISIYEARTFATFIPTLRKYIDVALKNRKERYINDYYDYYSQLERLDKMVIQDLYGSNIDYVSLDLFSSNELIKQMFVAIDSHYLNIHVDTHPVYN